MLAELWSAARKYAVAFKHAKKFKDNPNHWSHKKLKYALQDLKEAAIKCDTKDFL